MNGISHKQATQWIQRRLDGLLNENQLLALEEHLRSCDSCRTYAGDMDGLSAHLQNEFHRRWDERSGPSQNVMEQVTTKARRIPILNRISSGVRLVAGATTLILLALAINFVVSRLQSTSPMTNATETLSPPRAEGRLLAFASDQTGNSDIYTMHPEGSDLTNITNHPAPDTNPFWSPDGTRIAFESDRDGFTQIYSMNADGSDVTQLTHDESHHFLPFNLHGESNPWSPDGNTLLFIGQEPGAEASTLYSLDMKSGTFLRLADGQVPFNYISWSPDGKYIGYVLNDSPTPDTTFETGLYVIDAAGNDLMAITGLLPQTDSVDKPSYYWSRDRSSIVFIAYRHLDESSNQWIAYEFDLQNNQLIERATSSTRMEDWWEGTSFIGGDASILTWLRSDGTFNTFQPLEACDLTVEASYGFMARRSPNGNQVINAFCPNKDLWFYYANSDGTIIRPLMTSPLPSFNVDTGVTSITWSPDDQFIAITQVSSTKSSLYILNVKDPDIQPVETVLSNSEFYTVPAWQPLMTENIAREVSTPQPTPESSADNLIAFTAAGNNDALDIFAVGSDGTGLTNLTNHPAGDFAPVWSPEGQRIVFVSDRDGNNNIYLMNKDGSNLIRMTEDPASDIIPVWSPDGSKIAYMSSGDVTNIYVVDSNGQNRRQLTSYASKSFIASLEWSPDSQLIFFDNGQQIFEIDIDEGAVTPVTQLTDVNVPLDFALSEDGSKLLYLATVCAGAGQGNSELCYAIKRINKDGTNEETLSTLNVSEVCPIDQSDAWWGTYAKWSPDRTKVMFILTCKEGGGIYVAGTDGLDFQSLASYRILGNVPENEVASGDWSSDSQSILFMSALDETQRYALYSLHVNDALQNPDLRPTPLHISASSISSPAWQPISKQEVVNVPTLEPAPTQEITPESSLPTSTGQGLVWQPAP